MSKENLKETLKNLHTNLESAGAVDAELKSLLKVLDGDIQALLNQEDNDTPAAALLISRAQSISARFATEHPQLEKVMRELADTLARLGI